MISISIVSHGQGQLVEQVLKDLVGLPVPLDAEILVTLNIPEPLPFATASFPWPLVIVENPSPKGFGANHNAAFRMSKGERFCVMNPDVRLPENPFPLLLGEMERLRAALIAPAVLTPRGRVEDSVRHFPRALALASKMLGCGDGRYPFAVSDEAFAAEWVAGMFMLFRADFYRAVGGFDEAFFLYYEDVDICARLWKAGGRVLACPRAQVIHDARRSSRRNLRYIRWHLTSMARYFWKHWGRLPTRAVV
jgi:N-acetylglucosaminyl-diphospho-decaprenol L-rhamnosyltransferase